jgi:hypothetical protein
MSIDKLMITIQRQDVKIVLDMDKDVLFLEAFNFFPLTVTRPAELSWSKENVYYRSFRPDVKSFPGRILWYASQETGFPRQKSIVACSYLNNVVVEKLNNCILPLEGLVFTSGKKYFVLQKRYS